MLASDNRSFPSRIGAQAKAACHRSCHSQGRLPVKPARRQKGYRGPPREEQK